MVSNETIILIWKMSNSMHVKYMCMKYDVDLK